MPSDPPLLGYARCLAVDVLVLSAQNHNSALLRSGPGIVLSRPYSAAGEVGPVDVRDVLTDVRDQRGLRTERRPTTFGSVGVPAILDTADHGIFPVVSGR